MNYRNILPLVSHTQEFSTDYWNDFGYWNDGTFWYEKTPTYTARVTAYAAATGITDYNILDPLNIFDLGLTYYGLDTIMKAIYPMATDKTSQSDMANQMKYNFMNPLDTNAAFRLQWFGGWIYSRTGALPNGTTGYADTFLKPFSNLTSMNNHLSYYSRTNTTFAYDNGVGDDYLTSGKSLIVTFNHTTNISKAFIQCLDANAATGAETNTLGLIIGSRTSSTSLKLYRNGTLKGTNSTSTSISLPNENCFLGGLHYRAAGGAYSISYGNKQCAFASIGDGLTDFQADIFSTLVNNLQKALNRAVY